jgi:hypothetical protein
VNLKWVDRRNKTGDITCRKEGASQRPGWWALSRSGWAKVPRTPRPQGNQSRLVSDWQLRDRDG